MGNLVFSRHFISQFTRYTVKSQNSNLLFLLVSCNQIPKPQPPDPIIALFYKVVLDNLYGATSESVVTIKRFNRIGLLTLAPGLLSIQQGLKCQYAHITQYLKTGKTHMYITAMVLLVNHLNSLNAHHTDMQFYQYICTTWRTSPIFDLIQ